MKDDPFMVSWSTETEVKSPYPDFVRWALIVVIAAVAALPLWLAH